MYKFLNAVILIAVCLMYSTYALTLQGTIRELDQIWVLSEYLEDLHIFEHMSAKQEEQIYDQHQQLLGLLPLYLEKCGDACISYDHEKHASILNSPALLLKIVQSVKISARVYDEKTFGDLSIRDLMRHASILKSPELLLKIVQYVKMSARVYDDETSSIAFDDVLIRDFRHLMRLKYTMTGIKSVIENQADTVQARLKLWPSLLSYIQHHAAWFITYAQDSYARLFDKYQELEAQVASSIIDSMIKSDQIFIDDLTCVMHEDILK